MNKTAKIVLGILGGVGGTLLLCVGLVIGFNRFADRQAKRMWDEMRVRDPALIAQIAATMADYDLPARYVEAMVTKFSRTNALYILVTDDTLDYRDYPRITLVQFPPDKYASAPAAREEMRQADVETEIEDGQLTSTESASTTIRGQQVSWTIYYWVDHEGVERRSQISDLFEGKEGFLQLAIEGPVEGWDEEMIDGFLASIR